MCAGLCVEISKVSTPLGKYQGAQLLDHMVRLCLAL